MAVARLVMCQAVHFDLNRHLAIVRYCLHHFVWPIFYLKRRIPARDADSLVLATPAMPATIGADV